MKNDKLQRKSTPRNGFSAHENARIPRRHADDHEANSSMSIQASAPSQLNFRVNGGELAAGVVDLHVPVDAALGGVDVSGPSRGFFAEGLGIGETPAGDALASQ